MEAGTKLGSVWRWTRYPVYLTCFLAGLLSLRLFWIGGLLAALSSLLALIGGAGILRESSLALCFFAGYLMLAMSGPGVWGLFVTAY